MRVAPLMPMPELLTVTLRDPSSALTARFVPGAGMIGTSLSDDGVELLGQRRGLQSYVANGKTMGIPILYPWANRLGASAYTVDGQTVSLSPGAGGVRTDPNGLPIHGLLAAYPGWQVEAALTSELIAELDFGADPALLAGFPFPHRLQLNVTLADRTLTLRTTVTATSDTAVPLCFGFHPYLQIPETPRAQWIIETPAMRHLDVDERGLPTGATTDQAPATEPLRDKVFDDGYDHVAAGATFAVSGGTRRIKLRFDQGYSAAQIFAPAREDVVCFEPMAAPTDALRRGAYRCAHPDRPAAAAFSMTVERPD